MISGELCKNYKVVAGVIRTPTPSIPNWFFLSDDGHEGCNIDVVQGMSNGSIRLAYKFTAKKVVSFVATPHKSLIDEGYGVVGVTIGLTVTELYLSRAIRVSGRLMWYGNWEINQSIGDMTIADLGDGQIRVNHNNLFPINIVPVVVPQNNGGIIPFVVSWGADNFIVKFFDVTAGKYLIEPNEHCSCLFDRSGIIFPKQSDPIIADGSILVHGLFEV